MVMRDIKPDAGEKSLEINTTDQHEEPQKEVESLVYHTGHEADQDPSDFREQSVVDDDDKVREVHGVILDLELDEEKVNEFISDFFEQADDNETYEVVNEIAGMTEVSEDPTPETQVDATISRASSVAPHLLKLVTKTKAKRESEIKLDALQDQETLRASGVSRASELRKLEPDLLHHSTKDMADMNYDKSRKDTLLYDFGPRITRSEEEFLGEFEMSDDLPIFFDEIEEVEEASVHVEEEEKVHLNREPYYEKHKTISTEIATRKVRNYILQKKLAMYFRRRKMEYVARETDWSLYLQNKYLSKLEAYGELLNRDKTARETLNNEIDNAKKLKSEKSSFLISMFKNLQSREAEIGYGLIYKKTGKPIPDKLVERLLNRQDLQMNYLCTKRLKYLKLKQMVQEKVDAINARGEVAPGYKLEKYEHLKSVRKARTDKMEEREEELTKLRFKFTKTIQVLAHLREKSNALENDLCDLKREFQDLNERYGFTRTSLNAFKQKKCTYRDLNQKIINESGLLTEPLMLKDMEEGLTEAKVLSKQLDQILIVYRRRAQYLKAIRKKIEETKEFRRRLSKSSRKSRGSLPKLGTQEESKGTIYKGRPFLFMPTIDDTAFDELKSIKPKMANDRIRHNNNIHQCKKMDDWC